MSSKDPLEHALTQQFGHTEFRPLQREIITSTLSGNPTLAILPTGAGKSLTYQLPSYLVEGITLVISPLLSLIEDQINTLHDKGIRAARIDSTLNTEQRTSTLTELKNQTLQILYTSPESLSHHDFITLLKSLPIGLIAIDEAHCIAEWGHSFRPSYLFLPKIIRSLKPQCSLALTATATRKTASEIRKQFRIKTAHEWRAPNIRTNLHFQVTPCLPEAKNALLLDTLQDSKNLPAIVYVMRQIDSEEITHFLRNQHINARSYHAGMSTQSRQRIQTAFLNNEIDVIVATIAFGMGVDKPNIRSVIHYHLPKSPEGWVQESGRAGRDGKPSLCLTFACGDDTLLLENFLEAKNIRKNTLEKLLQSITSQGSKVKISPYHTRLQYDIHTSSLDILLARLTLARVLKFHQTSWRYVRAWITTGNPLSLTSYPKKHRIALAHIFSLDTHYDTFQSAHDFGIRKEKLWHILGSLHQQGEIVLLKKGWLWNYTIPHPELHIAHVVQLLHSSFLDLYHRDTQKIKTVEKIASSKRCITRSLAEYFGEKNIPECNQCTSCLARKARPLPFSSDHTIKDSEIATIRDLLKEQPHRFQTNQQLTRFLCGIPSPYLRHHRLTLHPHFGILKRISYHEVYAYAKALLNASD